MEPFAGSHGAYFGPSGRHMGHLKGHPGMKWGQLGCISGKRLVQRGRKEGHVLKTISFIMVLKQPQKRQGGGKRAQDAFCTVSAKSCFCMKLGNVLPA